MFLEFCYFDVESEDDQYLDWRVGLVILCFGRLPVDGTEVPKFVGFEFCEELYFDIWIYYIFRIIGSLVYRTEILYFVSEQHYIENA